MPTFDITQTDAPVVENPNIRTEPYRPIAVDSKVEPPGILLTHVEGAKWIAKEYYSQLTTADTEVASQELDRPEVYQQYLRIRDLELRVSSPLQPVQDTDNKEFTVVGTANLFPGIIPANGDMFVADIGDGRTGIFVVTEIRQLSMLRATVYEISYELKDYANQELLQDLRDKISKDTTFVRDFYKYGKNPLLVDSEYSQYQQILEFKDQLPVTYFNAFFNHDLSTLLVPDQDGRVYDPFLTEIMVRLVDKDKHSKWRQVKCLNRDEEQGITLTTLWDSFYKQDEEILNYCSHESRIISPRYFSAHPRFASVRYSGVDNVYYPKQDSKPSIGDLAASVDRVFSRPVDIGDIIADVLDGIAYPGITLESLVPIKPVTVDGYYVLSEAFYQIDYANMSLLEVLMTQYLDNQAIGFNALFTLCKGSTYWNRLEQFYYMPLLLLLLNKSIGDVN